VNGYAGDARVEKIKEELDRRVDRGEFISVEQGRAVTRWPSLVHDRTVLSGIKGPLRRLRRP